MRRSTLSTVLLVSSVARVSFATSDFDGDGRDDLVIPTANEEVNGLVKAGAVSILFGSGSGITATGDQYFDHATPGVAGSPKAYASFGKATATGDFNGDGRDDLAVGSPGMNVSGLPGAGSINVLYGTSNGLSVAGDQLWHRDVAGVARDPGASDGFGDALAAGDFDGDGFDDLAVGVPGELLEVGAEDLWNAGTVHVFYGSSQGLTANRDKPYSLLNSVSAATSEPLDRFGRSLAVGDFDNDGRDDLAIGLPGRSLEDEAMAVGAVAILYGTSSGLGSPNDILLKQTSAGIDEESEAGDLFGAALAAGDFDGDGADDLAIGVPGEGLDGVQQAGQVVIVYGGNSGISTADAMVLHQGLNGVDGEPGVNAQFGRYLVAGDFDGDGQDDLAIAASGATIANVAKAGSVTIFRGSNAGLSSSNDSVYSRVTPGVPGAPKANERFGAGLLAGDFDDDGRMDLAISVPGATVSGDAAAGLVMVLYGSASSAILGGAETWSQNSPGIQDAPAPGEEFGARQGPPNDPI